VVSLRKFRLDHSVFVATTEDPRDLRIVFRFIRDYYFIMSLCNVLGQICYCGGYRVRLCVAYFMSAC